jgi:hypothetical protein
MIVSDAMALADLHYEALTAIQRIIDRSYSFALMPGYAPRYEDLQNASNKAWELQYKVKVVCCFMEDAFDENTSKCKKDVIAHISRFVPALQAAGRCANKVLSLKENASEQYQLIFDFLQNMKGAGIPFTNPNTQKFVLAMPQPSAATEGQ